MIATLYFITSYSPNLTWHDTSADWYLISGLPYEQVLEELKELKQNEAGVSDKVFAYKYVLDPEGTMQKLQEEAIMMFAGIKNYEKLK